MAACRFDRQIQFRRAALVDDGFQDVPEWADYGSLIWAAREDLSADEKAVAGWIEASSAVRFVVRSSVFTRGLTAKDRLKEGDIEFEIKGISQIGRRYLLQIDAIAKVE